MTPLPRPSHALACLLAIGPGALVSAQFDTTDRFREVEPGFEDVSLFSRNQRFRPVDLREPLGFDRIYEIVDTEGLFARRSGAVTAVFDRSFYTGAGTPLIPPGTVFYIGELPVDLHRSGLMTIHADPRQLPDGVTPSPYAATLAHVDNNASTRADLRVTNEPRASDLTPRTERVSIWTDEAYRRHRISALIQGGARRLADRWGGKSGER